MRRFVLLVPTLLFACAPGVDSVDTATTSSRLAMEDFCSAYAVAACESQATCACSVESQCVAATVEVCRAYIMTPAVEDAIENGSIVYEPAKAWAVVESILSAGKTCEGIFDVLAWQHHDLLDFGGMLVGQLEPREKCTIPFMPTGPNECDRGICVQEQGGLVCAAVADVGEQCGVEELRGDVRCVDFTAPIGINIARADLLFAPCVAGVCEVARNIDMPCASDAWCESARCGPITSPTTAVHVDLDLDAHAAPISVAFSPADPSSYAMYVPVDVADQMGRMNVAELFLVPTDRRQWMYYAFVENDVIAVGGLVFDASGALQMDYNLEGGFSFELRPVVGPLLFDFGSSIHEGGSGRDGTVLAKVGGVRRVEGNQVSSEPVCLPKLDVGERCDSDLACVSNVCGPNVCVAANMAIGEACDSNVECGSGACVAGRCGAAYCR